MNLGSLAFAYTLPQASGRARGRGGILRTHAAGS